MNYSKKPEYLQGTGHFKLEHPKIGMILQWTKDKTVSMVSFPPNTTIVALGTTLHDLVHHVPKEFISDLYELCV